MDKDLWKLAYEDQSRERKIKWIIEDVLKLLALVIIVVMFWVILIAIGVHFYEWNLPV